MIPLHVVLLHETSIYEQLQLEEAILRADHLNWCLINEGAPASIVLGISGKVSELVHVERLKEHPVPLIRRFTGGGTVFIDENTYFVTFICNTSCVRVQPNPESIMLWTEQIYRPIFQPYPFQLKENDYVLEQRKCGGNAQFICKQRWLHHSSFLWDYSITNMEYLLMPPKMPTYRQKRSHQDFLCRLRDYWPCKQVFKNQLLETLNLNFHVQIREKKEIEAVLERPHRKATSLLE
jgi:lipoate-protein ligase A